MSRLILGGASLVSSTQALVNPLVLVDSSKDDGIFLPLVCEADKMSMLSAAALLDELMGVDRDRAPNEKKTALHWSDPQVFITKRMA